MAEGGELNEERRQTFTLFRMLGFDMSHHLQFLYLGWCPLGATQVQQGTGWLMTNKKKSLVDVTGQEDQTWVGV